MNYCEGLDLRQLPDGEFQVVDAPWATTWQVDANSGLVLNAGMTAAMAKRVRSLLSFKRPDMGSNNPRLVGEGNLGYVLRFGDLAIKYCTPYDGMLSPILETLANDTIARYLEESSQMAGYYKLLGPKYYGASQGLGSIAMDYIPSVGIPGDEASLKHHVPEVLNAITGAVEQLSSFSSQLSGLNPFNRDAWEKGLSIDIHEDNIIINGSGIFAIDIVCGQYS